MNKKTIVALIIAISSIFSTSTTITAHASNYIEEKEQIIQAIEENESKIQSLEHDFKENEDKITAKEREIVDVMKEAQAKKQVVDYSNPIDGLKLFEIVLKSDNMSEFMSNIKIAKKKMIVSNQSVVDINKKEEILKNENEELNEKQRELEKELSKAQKEKELLNDKKEKIENLIKDKEIETVSIGDVSSVAKGDIIFNPNNLTEISNAKVEHIYKVLEGTALYELAPVYVEAEKLYGVNAFFMMGLCAQESAWGTSYRAVHDNNLTGFGVYSDSSTGLNSQTKRDNILRTASWIKRQYLTPGGLYYNGQSIRAVNTRYCIGKDGNADYHWSENITSIAKSLLNKL